MAQMRNRPLLRKSTIEEIDAPQPSTADEVANSPLRNCPYPFFVVFRLLKPVLLDEFVIRLHLDCLGNAGAHGCTNRYHRKRRVFRDFFG